MEWYVNLVIVAATGALGWGALEFIGRPIRGFFDLRREVRQQMLFLANVGPPKPRETASTSRDIQEYDEALKAVREAQRILRDLGSRMLAFAESEFAAHRTISLFGYDAVGAGRSLLGLPNSYDKYGTDRADFRKLIEKSLRYEQ